jgi:hypothetical protein
LRKYFSVNKAIATRRPTSSTARKYLVNCRLGDKGTCEAEGSSNRKAYGGDDV